MLPGRNSQLYRSALAACAMRSCRSSQDTWRPLQYTSRVAHEDDAMVRKVGPYSIRRRIAVGGMAEVFAAVRDRNPSPIVIKLLLPHYCEDGEFLQMFADEASLTTRLSHPNLVRTLGTGNHQGRPYLVMELVDGCTLARLLARQGRLPSGIALTIAAGMLEGLDYLHGCADDAGHALNIVHRDINPRNVLLSRNGEVKLADFGIAHSRMRATRTRTGVIKGTVQYMSPEQITGPDVDCRTDLYSVGLVLFEMLTGEKFIRADREVELIRQAEEPTWRAPCRVNPELADDLDDLVRPALMRFPEQRYRSARAFRQAIDRVIAAAGIPPASRSEIGEQVLRGSDGPARELLISPTAPTLAATRVTSSGNDVATNLEHRREAGARRFGILGGSAVLVGIAVLGLWGWANSWWSASKASTARRAPTTNSAITVPRANRPAQLESIAQPASLSDTVTASAAPDAPKTAAAEKRFTTVSKPTTNPPTTHALRAPPRRRVHRFRKLHKLRRHARLPRRRPAGGSESPKATPSSPSEANTGKEAQQRELARLRSAHQRLRSLMAQRGLLRSDLSPASRARLDQAVRSLASGDDTQAREALDVVGRQVNALRVNGPFVQAKLQRVDRMLRRLPQDQAKVQVLRQRSTQALQAYMDGQFSQANRELNGILGALQN